MAPIHNVLAVEGVTGLLPAPDGLTKRVSLQMMSAWMICWRIWRGSTQT